MVKSILGVNHQGLTQWLIQRVSAVIMAVYTIGLLLFLLVNSNIDFASWHLLFSHLWMKIATLVFILFLLLHAWIGMWTIFTDYIKPFGWRFTLQLLTFLALIIFFLAALLILWSV
jgi:succinate dehydrogenase / fumarate reductase membrane anchor subunit